MKIISPRMMRETYISGGKARIVANQLFLYKKRNKLSGKRLSELMGVGYFIIKHYVDRSEFGPKHEYRIIEGRTLLMSSKIIYQINTLIALENMGIKPENIYEQQ